MKGNKKNEKVDITYEGNLDEEREMLADMIAIAMRDCISNIDKEVEKKLGAYSQQLGGLF